MTTSKRFLFVLGIVSFGSMTTFAQTKDETLIVIKQIEIKEGNTVVKSLRPGTAVTVLDVKGDKLSIMNGASGWVPKTDFAPVPKALELFNAQIKKNPKDAGGYAARGLLKQGEGDFDAAITDYTEAIRLDSKRAELYLGRGNSYSGKQEFDKAIVDFTDAIRLAPKSDTAYCTRGNSWYAKKEYGKAISDYLESNRISPNFDDPLNQLAWLMATCPDAKFRNGKKAVEYATKLCELSKWQEIDDIDTLAAAYAEAGDFANAVKWQTKAHELAPEVEKADYQSRIDLYKSGKPLHLKE